MWELNKRSGQLQLVYVELSSEDHLLCTSDRGTRCRHPGGGYGLYNHWPRLKKGVGMPKATVGLESEISQRPCFYNHSRIDLQSGSRCCKHSPVYCLAFIPSPDVIQPPQTFSWDTRRATLQLSCGPVTHSVSKFLNTLCGAWGQRVSLVTYLLYFFFQSFLFSSLEPAGSTSFNVISSKVTIGSGKFTNARSLYQPPHSLSHCPVQR
jgi:hypothetical protein